MTPEYLSEDRGGADVEFDFFRYGQMGTRRFNSFKLWMAMKFMGRARICRRQLSTRSVSLNTSPQRIDAIA